MKNLKKLFAIIMTVAVVLSMAMPTVAAESFEPTKGSYTLTITPQNFEGVVEYDIYQLFVANIDGIGATVYSKTGAANASMLAKTVEQVESLKGTEHLSELWDIVEEMKTTEQRSYATTTGGSATIKMAGYYLAVPKNVATSSSTLEGGVVSSPILVAVPKITKNEETNGYDVEEIVNVDAKDSEVTTDKAITGITSEHGNQNTFSHATPEGEGAGSTATLGEGDTITYTITNTVPTYQENVEPTNVNYYVVDEYNPNLEFVSATVINPTLEAGGTHLTKQVPIMNGEEYTVNYTDPGKYFLENNDAGHKFTVIFNYNELVSKGDVVIEAKFKLKGSAVPGEAIDNTSKLTYTNNYYNGTDSTLTDKVDSWTFKFDVYKYTKDEDGNIVPLPGAQFSLYKSLDAEGNPDESSKIVGPIESTKDGMVDFGLDLNDGTYYVKENAAPNGYRVDDTLYTVKIEALKDGVSGEYTGKAKITVNDEEITNKIDGVAIEFDNPTLGVENTQGQTLPGTGGIGTTIFTFGGLALIVLAGILLVVYTRKQKKA